MRYHRSTTLGATYFFTVVTYRRREILCEPDTVTLYAGRIRDRQTPSLRECLGDF
jgi:putative transposase